MPSSPYSPSNAQFDDLSSPLSESSGLDHTNHYDTQQEQTFSTTNSPFDTSPTTPEFISDEHITAHFSNSPSEGVSYSGGRPGICVDTCVDTLLLQSSNYEGSALTSGSQEASPGLLSPHSFTHENAANNFQPQLQRRHSHSRSAGDKEYFGLVDRSSIAKYGRGRGHNRVKSAPTSRHNSPYQRIDMPKTVSNIRAISPTLAQQPCGPFYPSKDLSGISPSDAAGKQVATERIRKASTDRRKYQPNCFCDECGDTFTTNFAKDRHMKSHTGERDYACTIVGCGQKFTTDSGRKRHEKSKTLHATSS